MAKILFFASTSIPKPEAVCPGCGSFRPADQPYCHSCLQEVEVCFPEALTVRRDEMLDGERGAFPLVDEGVLIL